MHNISSPLTGDEAIEQKILAKGLTAPRVTPADLAANISHVEYVKHVSHGGQILRWAVLTTKSGYAVVGDPSVAVSPASDNEEIGREVAFENSKNQLWPLMGYALKQKLGEGGLVVTDEMVSRFLTWRLPKDFAPDCGVSFKPVDPNSWPVGARRVTC
jgi:hypothetical protein